ncbi:S-layer protein [Lactiplantibacillus dongliensis]|uniref:S-layer protein n=1 Tax=Lactiplantibacillus dongliensis TaxID=2559919 RepID=A0ABW1R6M8_9LACO|nr:S-layer protein [Lactiplantibacillus dongliensis]
MNESIKTALAVGVAVTSLGVAAESQPVKAAGQATIVSNVTLKTAGYNRNMTVTGTNALYSKPGTVKGAKLIASKDQMQQLAASKKSTDYFRAYRVAQTNRGSVYYKVVSMDGRYRGYIYGGRDADVFAGGIKRVKTTKKVALPSKITHYQLANMHKNTLWVDPKYTQYKATKVDTKAVTEDTLFEVFGAEIKTREGSLYYHVAGGTEAGPVEGWVYAGQGYQGTESTFGGLKVDLTEGIPSKDNSVDIVYRANGQTVGQTQTFTTTDWQPKAGQPVAGTDTVHESLGMFIANHLPSGYQLPTEFADTTGAKYGQPFEVTVEAIK